MSPPGTCPSELAIASIIASFVLNHIARIICTDNLLGKSALLAHHTPWEPVCEKGSARKSIVGTLMTSEQKQ
jgi:hypothetical protein